MSFNVALTSPQLTELRRKRWQGDQNISLVDNVIAFQALVTSNLNSVGGSTTAAIPYNTVSVGAYTNLDEGMVVIISPNTDIRNKNAIRLHVRYLVANATNVYVSEFSDPVTVGSTIFVLYAYDIIDNLSRPVVSGGVITQYQQYDRPFQAMAPVINGAQTGYANWVDASTGYLSIAFDLSTSFAAEYGKSISSYLTTIKATGAGTYSVTSGSLSTSAFTLRFTYGEYWVKLTATDSNGVVSFRHVLIKAHHPTNYPPTSGFEGIEITRDASGGQSARIKAFAGVSSVLNGTMVLIWVGDEQYSDIDLTNTGGSLLGATQNIDIVGWIEAEEDMFMTDPTYSAYAECQFEVQGVGARLMRLEGQLLAITNNATPTLWDQINKLTIWRAIVHFLQRHTTALQLCSFTLQNMTTDETFLFPTLTTIAGRALDNCSGSQGLSELVNALLEFASDGRMQLTRREQFVAQELSHTPVIVATFDGRDMAGSSAFKWKFNHYQQYGWLAADGAAWDGTSPSVIPYLARAPGLAQGSGPDQGKLNNQVLASTGNPVVAQAELSQRAGTQWTIDNETGELTISHLSQHHWLQPSYGQVYIWDLDTTFNIRGLTLDSSTHWILKSLTVRHDNKTGSREVQGTYIPVITGTPAAAVPVIPPGSISPALPILPPMPAFNFELPEATIPDAGLPPTTPVDTKVTLDGQCVLEINNNGAALSLTRTFIKLASPLWIDITPTLPSGYTIKDACFDPFVINGKAAIYVLAANTSTAKSIVFYTPDAIGAAWQQGLTISSVFTLIRTTNAAGGVEIYCPDSVVSGASNTFTITFGTGDSPYTIEFGTIQPSGGNPNEWLYSQGADPTTAQIRITFSTPVTVTNAKLDYYKDHIGNVSYWCRLYDSDNIALSSPLEATVTPPNATWVNADSGAVSQANTKYAVFGTGASGGSGQRLQTGLDNAIITFTTPSISADKALVAYSADYGNSYNAIQIVGDTPGSLGGFDVSKAAGASVATCATKAVKKATTLGGSYAALATFSDNVTDLVIPFYRIGSDTTSQTTSTTPDVLVGLDGTVGGGSCVAWINSAGTIAYLAQPVANAKVIGPDRLTILRGTKIAGIFDVSGTAKLYVSENSGSTWTFVENVGANATLRDRRNDPRTGSHKGQLFVFDTTPSGYSSQWAFNGEKDRTSPFSTVIGGDVLG